MKHDNKNNNNEHKTIDSSARSILKVTIPILLTSLSTCMMFMVDRFMLAGYSTDSMNAAVMSGCFVSVFSYMLVGIASSAEVYVGQYNGDKQYEQLGAPTWQMLYLSLFSILIFFPIAYFSEYFNTLPDYFLKEGLAYQRPLMYFAFLQGMIMSLSAFFVGQGKTRIITYVIISGTILNVILDYFFIYTFKMGCSGAAIATVIAEIVQVMILAVIFFNRNNRAIYKTLENRNFNKQLFFGCIKIGGPLALGNFISMLAWYTTQTAVSHVSKEYATIYNIGINIYVFFIFFGDGLNKAIATISANMIGRKDLISIRKTYKFFIYMGLFFSTLVAIPMIIFPNFILRIFDLINNDIMKLHNDIKTVFLLVSLNNILETLMLTTAGVLNSGGDTRYPVIVNQTCIWILVIVPTIIAYYLKILDATLVNKLCMIWLSISLFLLYRRYRSLKWYNKLV